jgi:predicted AAA+ superfamily ATPase
MIPMIERTFWIQRIQQAWGKRPIIWLSGVRRVGETTLARMVSKVIYLNCDLPSVILPGQRYLNNLRTSPQTSS